MSVNAIPLLESKAAELAQTTQITSVGMVTIIDKFTAYNADPAAQTLTVNLVPPAGAAAAGNIVIVKTLQAGETYTFPEIVGHIIGKGGSVATSTSKVGVINIRASGRVIS